jgi:prepilin-type N-terminal cleavage/methylation domain-containing protein
MMMTLKRLKSKAAFTLVEIMVAILIMTLAVLGASGYRYYSALDARKAAMHKAAAEIALLLCESWRGLEGIDTYDPTTHLGTDLAITQSRCSVVPEGFALLGNYTVVSSNVNYYVTLSWKNVATGLRALNVAVAWSHRATASAADAERSFTLTTYTLN